jgi:HSP20 family protein
MRIVRYTPAFNRSLAPVFSNHSALAALESEMDRLLGSTFANLDANGRSGTTPIDLYEDKNHLYVRAELPGVRKEDVNIEIVDGYLNLQATRREKIGENEQTTSYSRSISLSEEIRSDGVSAALENGILTITMPKREETKPRKISVSVN